MSPKAALHKQCYFSWRKTPSIWPSSACIPTGRSDYWSSARRAAPVTAAARSASGANGGASDKRPGQQAGGGGGGAGGRGDSAAPGEPLILKAEEASRRKPTGPLPRSSYRRRKEQAEESKRRRAEYLAELAASSKRARVNYIGSSRPGSDEGPRVVLVDGYNVIHASSELSMLAGFRIQDARYALNRLAVAYAAANGVRVYVVYDAMGSGSPGDRSVRLSDQASAVFSATSEADTYIGQAALHWKRRGAQQVMVVSNDRAVQDSALDGEYVIFSVSLDTWLQQAHTATTSAARRQRASGSGATTAAAAAAALLAAPASPRGGSAHNSDGEGEGDGREEEGARVLRSSRELRNALLRLAASGGGGGSSEDDDEERGDYVEDEYEAAEGDGREWWEAAEGVEEEGVVDYLAAVEEGHLGRRATEGQGKEEEEEEETQQQGGKRREEEEEEARVGLAAAAAAASAEPAGPPSAASAAPAPAPAPAPAGPKPGLSGLLGKQGKARLSGLMKRATQDLT